MKKSILISEHAKWFKKVEYSPDVDALVITLSEEKPEYGEDVGENIIIHFSKGGKPVEIEILDASQLLISSMEAITLKARGQAN
jgi:uncharacterized protein YuzE